MGDAYRLTTEQIESYRRDGYLVLDAFQWETHLDALRRGA